MNLDDLFDRAERQRGYIRRDDPRAAGASRKVVARWIRDGDWVPAGSRLLRRRGSPRDKGDPLMRAVLDLGTGAVISHSTAAAWWGLPGFDLLKPHVTRPRGISGTEPSFPVHLHEVLDLGSDQVTVLDGIPIVRPERLAFELFASVHPMRAARAAEHAWSRGLLSGPSLSATFDELAGRGRGGTVETRAFLEGHGDGWIPPASNLEARFASVMEGAHYGKWRRQVDVGSDRWSGRVDFLHELLPLIVEVQSERYHAALLDRAADAGRLAQFESAGFVVVEVWDTWVWHDKQRLIAAVLEGIRAARARAAAA